MKKYLKFTIYLILFALFQAIFTGDFFEDISLKAEDWLFYFKNVPSPTNNTVIIDIDDNTFSSINQKWPFEREIHANLIENLKKQNAEQIIFDIEFTENSTTYQDSVLAYYAKKANCIFAAKMYYTSQQNKYKSFRLIKPIKPLVNNNNFGLVNVVLDSDGFVRNYKPYYEKYPALATKAVKNKSKTIPNADMLKINFYGKAKSIKTYSYIDFIDSKYKKEADFFDEFIEKPDLTGKTVFVGSSVSELHDLFFTPYGVLPGVEIQASFYEMCMQNKYLHKANFVYTLLAEFLLFWLAIYVYKKIKPSFSWLALIAFLTATFYFALYLLNNFSLIVPVLNIASIFAFCWVFSVLRHYQKSSAQKRFIKNAFQRYMAPELVKTLLKKPENLNYGGKIQEITVLFSDIRSFTTYTENHSAEDTVNILRQYLTEMTEIIITAGGTIDKYVGDEIFAIFGSPLKMENHAIAACQAAYKMRVKLQELQKVWQEQGIAPFEMGIGINTGQATVGNLGSMQIFDYTAIGDTVNLGARLEALNKEYCTESKIIISENTLKKVEEDVKVNYLDNVKVRGKQQAVKIYELKAVRLI